MKVFVKNINIISVIIIFLSAWLGYGYFQLDEHHQIFEFANSKIIAADFTLPWEYYSKLRPTIQPWIAFILIKFFHFLTIENPFFIAFFIRLLSGITFWIIILKTTPFWVNKYFKNKLSENQFKAIVFLLWFVPFIATRFSSENLSNQFLILGLFFFLKGKNAQNYFLAGFILAWSFFLRFQMGIIIFTILIYLIFFERKFLKTYLYLFLGSLPVIVMNIFLDFLFYEEWTISAVNYFTANILNEAASQFGIHPWYGYFKYFLEKLYPPFSLLLLFLFLSGLVLLRKNIMVWISISFIAVHFIIPHKELRFLFPIIFPFIIITTHSFIHFYKTWKSKKWFKVIFKVSIIANFVFLFFRIITSASDDVIFDKLIYDNLYQANNNIITLGDSNEYSIKMHLPKTFYMPKPHQTTNSTAWTVKEISQLDDWFKKKQINKSLLIIKSPSFDFPDKVKDKFQIKKINGLIYSINISQQLVNPNRYNRNPSLYLISRK